MRLRTIRETPLRPTDQVFMQSRLMWVGAVVFGLVMLGIGVLAILHRPSDSFGWIFTGIATLVVLPFVYIFLSTFHPQNWILRCSPPKILIKIRSYANRHLPDADPVILELDTSEIEWIRVLRQQLQNTWPGIVDLELKLRSEDLSQLQEQFAAERERRQRRLTVAHDPVRLRPGGIISIEWRGGSWITPRVEKAIQLLRGSVEIREEQTPAGQIRTSDRQVAGRNFDL